VDEKTCDCNNCVERNYCLDRLSWESRFYFKGEIVTPVSCSEFVEFIERR
jgi:hypothetical protein